MAVAALAAVACTGVSSGAVSGGGGSIGGVSIGGVSESAVQLGLGTRGLLLAAACLLAVIAFTAAKSLAATRDAQPGMA